MKTGYPDGPTSFLGLRTIRDLRKHDLLELSQRLTDRHGKVVHAQLFHKHLYFISDPEIISAILEDPSGVYDKIDTRTTIHHIAGNSLNTLRSDQDWAEKQALFDRHIARNRRIEEITDQKLDDLLAAWGQRANAGQNVDASIDLLKLSTSITSENFFRQSVDDVDFDELDRHKYYVVKAMLRRQFQIIRLPKFLDRKLMRAFRFRDGLVKRLLENHLALPERPDSYMNDLVEKYAIRKSDRRAVRLVRGEVLSALYLASDPFDKLLAKSLYYLARLPHEAGKIRDEISRLQADEGLSLHSVSSLRRLRHFLMEVLRLKTPYAIVGREARLGHRLAEYVVPRKSLFAIMPLIVHKDGDYWERPTEFDPSRFERISLREANYFIPFSAGDRKCPGQGFAMRQAMYIVARIAMAYNFDLIEGFDYSDEFMGVLSSKNHYLLRIGAH